MMLNRARSAVTRNERCIVCCLNCLSIARLHASSQDASSVPHAHTWNFWSSGHPDARVAQSQELEWQELTLDSRSSDGSSSATGLVGGLLRLAPFKELPTHYHPEPFGEVYHFTRGNGYVKLAEYTPQETRRDISPGVHVNIPARTLHGIQAGGQGCEFLWMFPGRQWREIPYVFADPRLPSVNAEGGLPQPLPVGVADWEALQRTAAASRRETERTPEL
mmetsp:Transcript_76474/g.236810  ORF Transcript_76474/g.236810 Transcript_76474/m.236810 type:complete len:220 (-) Transcript_76474:116-775(-)